MCARKAWSSGEKEQCVMLITVVFGVASVLVYKRGTKANVI